MSEAQGKHKRHGAGEREEVPKKRRECLEGDQGPTVAQEKRATSSSADDGEEGMEEDAKRIRASEDAALVLHIGRMAGVRRQSSSAERRAREGEKGRRPREWDGKHEAIERTIREMSILGVDVDKMRARGEGSNEKWSEEEQDAMGALHDRDECAHDHGWDAFDDISGEMLDAELVKKARREEIQEFERIGVWQWTTVEECHRVTGKKPVGTRWVDVNKGDKANPEIRSRLVAQEFKVGSFADLFAGMPPLEAKKALFSLAASGLHASGNPLKLAFIDVKKAYLYAKVTRPTYVALPPEVAAPPRVCGRLMVSLYGTRDAAMNWEREYTDTLKAIGLVQGRSSPCIFYCERRDLRVVVHGDDFTVLSDRAGIDFVHAAMKKKYIVKLRGVLGPEHGDDKEIRILNRVLRYTESGLELEADQRHAEILVRDIGVMGSKGVNTPGVKERGESLLKSQALRPEDARVFRMLVARGNYLAQDRPDIQFSVKELSRAMSSPSQADWVALKRLGRYLRLHPRVVIKYRFQQAPASIQAFADSDWAGCKETRKSTFGGVLLLGSHAIKTWSNNQSVIALSSGEAEYYAVVKAATHSIGCVSMLRDMGCEMSFDIFTDSSAAMGISMRTGLGKVRHIDTRLLWVQQKLKEGKFRIRKVDGCENPADLLTKHVSGHLISKHMESIGAAFESGRSLLTPMLGVIGRQCQRCGWTSAAGGELHEA